MPDDTSTLPEQIDSSGADARRIWFLRGARTAFSVPGLILASAFVGFAGLAREAGLTLVQAVFMTGMVWALPAATFAVALSSIRLMPMVVALVPELKGSRTPKWLLYLLSHCVAVTSWVLAMERVGRIPREMRAAYYAGLGFTLVLTNMVVVGVVYTLAGNLPPIVSAGLLLLTPMYFLTSLWGSARERAGHVAMVLGLGLGPIFHTVWPGFDLLAAGLTGGMAAYIYHRLVRRRVAA